MARKNALTSAKKKKAVALVQTGQLQQAKQLYQQVCKIDPVDAGAWFMLGAVHGLLAEPKDAMACCRRATSLEPNHSQAHYNLATALKDLGQLEEAVAAYREALRCKPDYADAWEGLAFALMSSGHLDEAITAYREVLRYKPRSAKVYVNLGALLQAAGRLGEAETCYREAQRIMPAIAHENLGSVLSVQGRLQDALDCFREGLKYDPVNADIRSNLLLTLNYLPDQEPGHVLATHRAWGEVLGRLSSKTGQYTNSRDPRRRLKIGYVSPDFRNHSVAYFFEPLLAAHQRDVVEVTCYSNASRPDAITQQLQSLADQWRDISAAPDEHVASMIRSDGIDVLVDLAGHTYGNRLGVFANRPAPVQITWLGYPNTTGLSAIDYRLTDALADPEGEDKWFTESLVRLPGCFLCYHALADAPSVVPPPAVEAGHVTFGSFNNLAKINRDVIRLWAWIVNAVPGASLLVKNPSLSDSATRERYRQTFEAEGLQQGQVELTGHTPTPAEHLALYGRVDIALDTFPYNGTTTTCEALWMGVPVVTLLGRHHAGRVGGSLLNAAGLSDWVAGTTDQYIGIACGLAGAITRLTEIRARLRGQLAASPLCDAEGFAHKVEAAYRDMWRRWCDSGK